MIELIRKLCMLDGISGRENDVRSFIVSEINEYADDINVDSLGNLLVFKKGASVPDKKIMFDAHMDEVGFIVTGINEDGSLSFANVGGINAKSVVGKNVCIGSQKIPGVIGLKPIHLCSSDERSKLPENLFIDIGTESEEESSGLISVGDYICYSSDFVRFGDGFIKGRSLDDRAGCALLISLIKSDLPYDTYFSFSTCEEVGSGFAGAAAEKIKPHYAVVVETTTASDISLVGEDKKVCYLGKGPVISFMDRRTVYPYELFRRTLNLASSSGIKAQIKKAVAGGNNAGNIIKSAGGIKTVAVSLPCRYLHSPSCVLKVSDIEDTLLLLKLLVSEFAHD